jgi:hypothetical protein
VATVGSVSHFLSENVGNGGFAADMPNGDSAISNPLASGILTILNVAIAFGGHIVTPFDTGIVVAVQDGGTGGIVDWIAQGREVFNHVASFERQSQTHVCGLYFSFEGAQTGTLLPISFPTDQSARGHDNGSTHATELKEWQLDALANCISEL